MKRTVYLPDELDAQLEQYLREHPGESVSSFVQEAVENKLALTRPTDFDALLSAAGLIEEGVPSHSERPEDDFIRTIRDSRDI